MNSVRNESAVASRVGLWVRIMGFIILGILVWQTNQMLLVIFVGILLALLYPKDALQEEVQLPGAQAKAA